jgi:uncharacterized protein
LAARSGRLNLTMATKDRSQDSHAVSVQALCREGATLSGAWPQNTLTRLAESLFAEPSGNVVWSAVGEEVPAPGGEPELWLRLSSQSTVTLQCQRCLKAVQHDLQVDRRFRFARSEAEAEKLDEVLEEDVLALQPRLNLQELAEDELILALPLVARHQGSCPDPLPLPADDLDVDEEAATNPFAALAALKTRN